MDCLFSFKKSLRKARMGQLDRERTTLSQNTNVKWQLDTAVFRMVSVENRRPILLGKRHSILVPCICILIRKRR
ncbi:unnamed protein product [Parnassius mnemosyne]|uniref:Uncharacterized protein n=1 Tax=Parnassius mnemosyne TaxID=213953 RepID=A0AAV1L8L3_9NEOP